MQRVKLVISYDGTDFHGFARQQSLRTVQGTLEDFLRRTLGRPVEVFGSGRTDAGVHARAQVVHWDQASGPPVERYPYVLRRSMPRDIVAVAAEAVPFSFHARFSAKMKTYRYTIQRDKLEDVFTNRFAWHVTEMLDLSRMESASRHFLGEHDFTSFCAAATAIEDKTRTIYDFCIKERGSYLDFYCTGSGFLQHMVRILVGTLVDVGKGRLQPDDIPNILQIRDRVAAGVTAPPQGLTLWNVAYAD